MLAENRCAFERHVGRIMMNRFEFRIDHAEHVGSFHGRNKARIGPIRIGCGWWNRFVDLPTEQGTIAGVDGKQVAQRSRACTRQANEEDRGIHMRRNQIRVGAVPVDDVETIDEIS